MIYRIKQGCYSKLGYHEKKFLGEIPRLFVEELIGGEMKFLECHRRRMSH